MTASEGKLSRQGFLIGIIIGFMALATAPLAARAAGESNLRTLWQIGRFDHASEEFNSAKAPTPAPVYMIGKSRADKDWYGFQPGNANGKAGTRLHPFTIRFDLNGTPKGVYTLKVGMVVRTRRLSILQVDLNGHRGWYYQRPRWHDVPGAKFWVDLANVEFPARDFHAGSNTLVLTAIDQPSQRDDVSEPGITYDALALEQDPAGKYNPGAISAEVHPTIFYQRKDGHLVELVDVYTSQNAPAAKGRLTLVVNKQKFTEPLSTGRDFGEQRVEFSVPEFSPDTRGEVLVRLGRRRRRFPVTLQPAKKWKIYVVPHEHLDVGFTDYQSKVVAIHNRVVDEALHMIDENPQFRYSTDGFWVVQHFLAGRDAADRKRLDQAVADHKFFVPAQYANLLTGFPTVETLIRSLYPSFEFDQKHNEPFDYANITDVPSYTWSYASILADAGIKYLLAGCDQARAPILDESHLLEKSPFWWEGPDGKKVLMWYSDSYGQVGAYFGLPPQVVTGHAALPRFLDEYPSSWYKPDSIVLFGAQWENSDLFPQNATIVGNWNKTYAYPHLIYSGFVNALQHVAKDAGNSIPVYRGDGGPYWEDGIASDSYYAAMNRRSEQRALTAEKISTLNSLLNPRSRPDQTVLDNLWQNLILYDEHTWGAAWSISSPHSEETLRQLAVKDSFAIRAHHEVQDLIGQSMAGLADKIQNPKGTWVVFNPLNWKRSELVTTDLWKGLQIIDLTTHQPVPYQVLSVSGKWQHIRFMARDVPSLGYKCYALKPIASPPPSLPKEPGDVMENAYYRIVLAPQSGAVKSIFDKGLHKEIVNASSPYRFDQYLYVTGGDKPANNQLIRSHAWLAVPKLTVHPAAHGRLISITRTPFGTVARLESSAVNTPRVESEIILFNHQKKIEFVNRVHKREVYTKEGVYFAFPLAMNHPEFHYEIQNGYVNPARDQLPGAGKVWFSVQHWVEADAGGTSVAIVPIDASLVTLGGINRAQWPMKFGRRKGTIFSYVMNNYWFTNYRAGQGGDFTFRYVLTSDGAFHPAALSRLGWSEMTPLEIDDIVPNDKAVNTPEPLNSAENSFATVESPQVVMVDWKRAENHQGTIMRFVEVAGKNGTVRVHVPLMDVQQAWECSAMEQNQKALQVSAHGFQFNVTPFQIVTVRVEGNLKLPAAK